MGFGEMFVGKCCLPSVESGVRGIGTFLALLSLLPPPHSCSNGALALLTITTSSSSSWTVCQSVVCSEDEE
jgi:hypothetical protein